MKGTLNKTRESQSKKDAHGQHLDRKKIQIQKGLMSKLGLDAFDTFFTQSNNLEILRPQDVPALLILSEYFGQWQEITTHINKVKNDPEKKYTGIGANKQQILKPLLRQQKEAAKMVIEIGKQFALTPAIRAHMNLILPADGESPPPDKKKGGSGKPDLSHV
jgi:phage terminase small subunit